MKSIEINNYLGMNVDFSGFTTIFISFLMIGNWLSIYLITIETLIKTDTFLSEQQQWAITA